MYVHTRVWNTKSVYMVGQLEILYTEKLHEKLTHHTVYSLRLARVSYALYSVCTV